MIITAPTEALIVEMNHIMVIKLRRDMDRDF